MVTSFNETELSIVCTVQGLNKENTDYNRMTTSRTSRREKNIVLSLFCRHQCRPYTLLHYARKPSCQDLVVKHKSISGTTGLLHYIQTGYSMSRVTRCGHFIAKFWLFLRSDGDICLAVFNIFDILKHFGTTYFGFFRKLHPVTLHVQHCFFNSSNKHINIFLIRQNS